MIRYRVGSTGGKISTGGGLGPFCGSSRPHLHDLPQLLSCQLRVDLHAPQGEVVSGGGADGDRTPPTEVLLGEGMKGSEDTRRRT